MDAITSANKRTKFAWAKYDEVANDNHRVAFRQYSSLNKAADDRQVPEHIKEELKNMAKELKKKWECPICYDFYSGRTTIDYKLRSLLLRSLFRKLETTATTRRQTEMEVLCL